jgi:hypothetical protein
MSELAALRNRVRDLEIMLDEPRQRWRPTRYYAAYYATTGALLGIVAATVSLLFNVAGSLVWPQSPGEERHPLRLIQVYLTFPLGEAALEIDDALTLAMGCCLYLGTGMLYGVAFQMLLAALPPRHKLFPRLALASAVALAIWLVNFYGILSWLQPALLGGNWIVDLVPWWVAALTHLVFGWTMVLAYPWGLYETRRPAPEAT